MLEKSDRPVQSVSHGVELEALLTQFSGIQNGEADTIEGAVLDPLMSIL